MEYNIMTLST